MLLIKIRYGLEMSFELIQILKLKTVKKRGLQGVKERRRGVWQAK